MAAMVAVSACAPLQLVRGGFPGGEERTTSTRRAPTPSHSSRPARATASAKLPKSSHEHCLASAALWKLTSATALSKAWASSGKRSAAGRAVRCEIAVELGGNGTASGEKAAIGSRIKVTGNLKVYHIPKVPEYQLEGSEGEVKDVLGTWKGKSVSANLPYKVQFFADIDGKEIKFFAHLKDDEFEVL